VQLPSRYFNPYMLKRKRDAKRAGLTPAPTASFTYVEDYLEVTFTDTSTGTPTSWAWDFGDGNTSTLQNPVHTYATSDTFTVSLVATNLIGDSEPYEEEISVVEAVPENLTLPTHNYVATSPVVGTQITGTIGEWTNTVVVEFTRWEQSDDGTTWATAAADMPLEDSPPTNNQFGKVLRVVETATNDDGFVVEESAATGAVGLPTENLLAWWYGGNGSVAEALVGVADGEAVTTWADKSATDVDLTKAGSGTITYRQSVAALGNRGGVQLDGSARFERTVAGLIANESVYSLYIVFTTGATTDMALYSEGSNVSATPFVVARLNDAATVGRIRAQHRSDAAVIASLLDNDAHAGGTGAPHVLTLRRAAATSWSLRFDGIEVATDTDNVGATTVTKIVIGALYTNNNTTVHFDGHIGLIAAYEADNYATIEPILEGHYGVEMPPF
jgi:PKD repeat protein